MAKKIWDLDRLMSDADAFIVAERIGLRKRRCGSSTYIECVEGTHKESSINHNQLFRDGCHCYSCGASHNIYGMVRDYYKNIVGISLEHDEICYLIAETCGGEDEYLITPVHSGARKKRFPLTKEELEAIGLASNSQRARHIVSYADTKDDKHRELLNGGGYADTELLPPVSIYSLYREDEELFQELVGSKIKETIEKARAGYQVFKDAKDDLSKALVRVFIEKYNAAKSAELKIFPSGKRAVS